MISFWWFPAKEICSSWVTFCDRLMILIFPAAALLVLSCWRVSWYLSRLWWLIDDLSVSCWRVSWYLGRLWWLIDDLSVSCWCFHFGETHTRFVWSWKLIWVKSKDVEVLWNKVFISLAGVIYIHAYCSPLRWTIGMDVRKSSLKCFYLSGIVYFGVRVNFCEVPAGQLTQPKVLREWRNKLVQLC